MHQDAMQQHFERLAPRYNELRRTDSEPVEYLRGLMADDPPSLITDVGCGGGRYSLLLRRALPKAHLLCCDINRAMLDQADTYLRRNDESNYSLQLADADSFAALGGKFDCIVSFNAIHHFNPVSFLRHARQVLRPGGQIFIYTRLQEQNKTTIWGNCFPGFAERETRLYRRETIDSWNHALVECDLTQIKTFSYSRQASLQQLLELAANRHYSTFEFYSERELKNAISGFSTRVKREYHDLNDVRWLDHNIMIQFRACV
jgi:SAM-dependent methyltransferase